ncbi:MAG: hypothetical protein V7731_18335 [Amphritea sp.]
MKIIVALPYAEDVIIPPVADCTFQAESRAGNISNPLIREAVEEGLRLKNSGPGNEVILAVMGDQVSAAPARMILNMGFDRGIRIPSDTLPGTMEIAELLIDVIQQESPDLILIGKESANAEHNQVGRMLAELLDFRYTSQRDISDSTLYRLLVIREIGSGIHTVELPLVNLKQSVVAINKRPGKKSRKSFGYSPEHCLSVSP